MYHLEMVSLQVKFQEGCSQLKTIRHSGFVNILTLVKVVICLCKGVPQTVWKALIMQNFHSAPERIYVCQASQRYQREN